MSRLSGIQARRYVKVTASWKHVTMSGLVRIDSVGTHAFHDGHETRDVVAGIRSWIDVDLRLCVD